MTTPLTALTLTNVRTRDPQTELRIGLTVGVETAVRKSDKRRVHHVTPHQHVSILQEAIDVIAMKVLLKMLLMSVQEIATV